MKSFTKFIMSVLFILMLGCSYTCNIVAESSKLTSINIESDFDSISARKTFNKHLTNDIIDSTSQASSQYVDSIYKKLYEQVMNYVSQTSRQKCTEKNAIAKMITDTALEHDIDICFILAQGTIETHLGTTGIGRTRKSIFGVYRTYGSYKKCIDDYVKILKSNYLVRGRTEHHLMQHYINKNGKRYAKNAAYEKKLRHKYNEICSNTMIRDLQKKTKTLESKK